jgi:hypothetical protein
VYRLKLGEISLVVSKEEESIRKPQHHHDLVRVKPHPGHGEYRYVRLLFLFFSPLGSSLTVV